MSENTEITSNGKTLRWSKGKASHVCTKEELITEIHDTLFKSDGLVQNVTLINDRQGKGLDKLEVLDKELKEVLKKLANMEGQKKGEGISFKLAVTLITIALGIGAFIMNLIKK